MTIKQQGGIFGRNPTFKDVTIDDSLTTSGNITTAGDIISSEEGINTPTADGITVERPTGSASPTPVELRMSTTTAGSDWSTTDPWGRVAFYSKDTSGGGGKVHASMEIRAAHSSGGRSKLAFKTNLSSSDTLADALVLDPDTGSGRHVTVSDGNLVIGTSGKSILCGVTSTDRNAVVRADLSQGVVGSAVYISRSGGSTSKSQIEFANSNGVVGSITTSGNATAYNTSSDYRLKTDAQPMKGASDRVKSLKPVNFEWLSGKTRVDGFIAHEVQAVVPEAVHGEKDAMREEEYEVTPAVLDEEGNVVTKAVMGTQQVPDYQAIDQSKLVPLLTAALQEALAKIEQLEVRFASLEV
jgi:hypothetical protein